MYELKNIEKVLTSKSVRTGPSSYEKRIYRAAVSQRLRNTAVEDSIFGVYHCSCCNSAAPLPDIHLSCWRSGSAMSYPSTRVVSYQFGVSSFT
jgi:hypothetical protein